MNEKIGSLLDQLAYDNSFNVGVHDISLQKGRNMGTVKFNAKTKDDMNEYMKHYRKDDKLYDNGIQLSKPTTSYDSEGRRQYQYMLAYGKGGVEERYSKMRNRGSHESGQGNSTGSSISNFSELFGGISGNLKTFMVFLCIVVVLFIVIIVILKGK